MADTTGIDLETAQSCVTTNTTAWAWRNLGLYGDNENGTKLIIAYEARTRSRKNWPQTVPRWTRKPLAGMRWSSS